MPIWLILILAAGPALGLIYCLDLWNAARECRACRVAFFLSGEVVGGGLLFSGWNAGGGFQFALGTVILLMLNLYLGLRVLVWHLRAKQSRQESLSQDRRLTVAAMGAAAVAATQTLLAASKETVADDAHLSTGDGADLDLDL